MFVDVDHLISLSNDYTGALPDKYDFAAKKSGQGRNDKLKSMVAASFANADSLNTCAATLITYDATHHSPPLFSDESEAQMKGGDVQTNALRFIWSNAKSINQQRLAKGLPLQYFTLDGVVAEIGKEIAEIAHPLSHHILLGDDLLNLQIPEQDVFIDSLVNRGGIAMVFAKRGVGKTFFLLEMGLSLATGSDFFSWKVPTARKVLYIDGEMSLAELQYRIKKLLKGKMPKGFSILPSELLYKKDKPLNINNPLDQSRLKDLVKEVKPDVLILDNLSSLSSGRDENSNSDMDTILQWLVALRHQGVAVILAHHAGKNNEQRGASRLEDILDTTIKLTENPCSDGASFKIEFTKSRGKKPTPYKLDVALIDSGDSLDWEYNKVKPPPNKIVLLQHINEGQTTQKDIANLMDKDKGYISNLVKVLKAKGHLEDSKKLTITPQGKAELTMHSPDNFLKFNTTEYYDDNL